MLPCYHIVILNEPSLGASLRSITIEAGAPEKYNATITFCLGFLAAERIGDNPTLGWDELAERNPGLLEWPNERLALLFPNGAIHTERARQMFVLPGAHPHSQLAFCDRRDGILGGWLSVVHRGELNGRHGWQRCSVARTRRSPSIS